MFCPIMSKSDNKIQCLKNDCELYNEERNCCAFYAITLALEENKTKLQEIDETLYAIYNK